MKKTIGKATLYCGDSADILKELEAQSIDSVVTDPPYGLSFMGSAWDYEVPQTTLWEAVAATMKPGAHLLSFFGSRTYHRGCVAIEDAGLDIRDQIMWVYGSGFPKSHDVSKAIDKAAGAQRQIVGSKLGQPGYHLCGHDGGEAFGAGLSSSTAETRLASSQITAPATAAAKQWQGWGTGLKPAHEPIVLARKPFRSTVAANVLAHGCGALNIDGCRVESADLPYSYPHGRGGAGWHGLNSLSKNLTTPIVGDASGRFPANIIHDGSEEVLAGFPDGKGFAGGGRFFYCAKASKRDRSEGMGDDRSNRHPTVKPTTLMAYLCRLVTPDGGVILDPFMGSGSTGKAAMLEGFRFIGIERDPEYFEVACARIAAAQGL